MTHLYLGPLYHGPPYYGPHPRLTCTMTHRTMVYIHDSPVPWSTGQWPISIYNWPEMTCIHKLLITHLIYINRRSARARDIGEIHTQRTDGTEGIYYTTQSTIHQLPSVWLSDGFYVIINSMIVESCVVVITRYAKQHFTRLHCDSSK